jgi:ribosomal protein S12 methylthiotransferase accessory factor
MGRCEFGWRDYIEAADRFREALDRGLSNPMKQEAEYLRGESHVHLEEFDVALDALRNAEKEGRADSPLYFYQGLCLLGAGNPGGAAGLLKKALDTGPSEGDLFHVLFYIAHALKESEAFSEALSYCTRALSLDENNQELYNLKGFCHFKLTEHDEAILCFQRCIEIDPRSAIDYANIGSNLREKGELEEAAALYRKALAMDPDIEFARDSLRKIEKILNRRSAT